jgi:hypothetical protein
VHGIFLQELSQPEGGADGDGGGGLNANPLKQSLRLCVTQAPLQQMVPSAHLLPHCPQLLVS